MPVLEIRRRSGKVEIREISKQAPVLVGRLTTNDIQVDSNDVAPVHCRISWKRGDFEVAAVTAEGVEWNGAIVQQATLSRGDIVRVGSVEIVLRSRSAAAKPAPASEPEPHESRPQESKPHESRPSESRPPAGEGALAGVATSEISLRPVSEEELPVRSFQLSADLSPDQAAPEAPPVPPAKLVPRSHPPEKATAGMSRVERETPEEQRDMVVAKILEEDLHEEPRESTRPLPARTRRETREKPRNPKLRPGEQETLRSPLVVGLGVGTLLLLLAAVSIWFVLDREAAQREYDAANALLQSGQYGPGIEAFETFLRSRPRHRLAADARLAIATARVEQPISGGVPAWDAGLEALDGFITAYRETPPFQDVESPVRKFVIASADRIAMGAAENARTSRKRPLLAFSAQGAKLLELYSPAESPPTERLREIGKAVRAAETAILQQETYDALVRKMDEALAAEKPLAALGDYRQLLDRYPNAAEYRPLNDRLKKSFDLERSRTVRDESRREAIREDRPHPLASAPFTLTKRVRTRSDVASTGGVVFVTTDASVTGVDTATGEPLWTRAIGLDAPFVPVPIPVGVPAVLVYDTRHHELLLLQQRTGALIWRLAFESPPRGAPLVFEGELLVATAGGTLEQIDVETGACNGRLKFSQELVGPPAVSLSRERLYLPGKSDVLYVLTHRPLGCERVVWLGHGPGAILAPPLMMRAYLFLAENDRADKSRIRVFDSSNDQQPPRQIAEHSINGQIRDSLAVRGKQLVVPSSPERISAFTVAETGDAQSLAFIAEYAVKDPRGGPVFVTVGPDDQLWMTSTALRRFTISRESLLPDKQELAVGLASQPLQVVGDSLYIARRTPYSRAVLFAEADRVRMAAQWQTAVGAEVLGSTAPASDGAALCVTTLGDLFQVSPQKVARGGFELQSLAQVPVPEGLTESLSATRLRDGRLAISCGGSEPRLWIVGNDAVIRETKLEHRLQADPVSFGPGILLPLPGRLRLVGRNGDAAIAEDLPAPITDSTSAEWRAVVPLDDSQALALNSRGRLSRIQFRTSTVAHLAEVANWDAGQPVDGGLALDRGRALLADTKGRLILLDAATFEPRGQFDLQRPASQSPWIVGDQAFVEVAASQLVCCDLTQGLAKQWEIPLDGESLAGAPIRHADHLLIALSSGRILLIEPASGEIKRTLDLEQRIGFGPEFWGEQMIVGLVDGSLRAINAWFESSE
jgi:hypothetical protein